MGVSIVIVTGSFMILLLFRVYERETIRFMSFAKVFFYENLRKFRKYVYNSEQNEMQTG